MATWLKQSTTITLRVGPFLDKTDGVTEETALSPAVEISKAGGAFAARNSATAIAHDSNGWYSVELNATDTNTLGILLLKVDDAATHLPVWHEYMVLPAVVYDSLVAGSDNLQVDVTQWLGTAAATPTVAGVPEVDMTHLGGVAQSATDLKDFADDGYDPATNKVQGLVLADALTTNNDKTGYSLSAAGIQAIWDALTSALITAGSIGKRLADNIDAVLSTRATPAQVNAEVLDVLNVDTFAEPGQGAPPATATLVQKLGYVYKVLRNKITQDNTTLKVYADDGVTVDQKATISDDSTTYTRGELGSGP